MEAILLLAALLAILLLWSISAEGRASRLAQQNEQLQEQLTYVVTIMQQKDNDNNSGCAPLMVLVVLALAAAVLLVLIR